VDGSPDLDAHARDQMQVDRQETSIKGESGEDMSQRTDAKKKGAEKNTTAFAEVLNNLASTNVSMVAAMEDCNKIAREEGSRQQQDADSRKQDADLKSRLSSWKFRKTRINLPEDRRNKLEAYCSECEETM
jgi:hypothetical protein